MKDPIISNLYEPAMRVACAAARQWVGATAPNPPVGAAAIDTNGNIIATAAHRLAGTAHAESLLLKEAQEKGFLNQIETLCVTLEPCNHQGRTPPCTEAIIASGIKRVVIGCRDPNPHVKGQGLERLQEAGIEIIQGVSLSECQILLHPFTYHAQTGLPWITVKRAFDRTGSMIPPHGQKTFTSQSSLVLAHRLRKKADAILTGSGTILADSPEFTVRHVSDYSQKTRFLAILDRSGRVPNGYLKAACERGFEPVIYQEIEPAIRGLARQGVRDILVEAGPILSAALLDCSFWNMSVTMRIGDSDTVATDFNTKNFMPFAAEDFSWSAFLPA